MEHVSIYKPLKNWYKAEILVGSLLLLTGTILLFHHLYSSNSESKIWPSGMIMLQGLLSLLLGYFRKREENLFIEWDENEIRYRLLKDKSTQIIQISEIMNINGNATEIRIQLAGTEKILHLEGIFYQDMKRVREYLQTLQETIKNRNQNAKS